jgi:hypothetical protein
MRATRKAPRTRRVEASRIPTDQRARVPNIHHVGEEEKVFDALPSGSKSLTGESSTAALSSNDGASRVSPLPDSFSTTAC